jgi:hypothetical protein
MITVSSYLKLPKVKIVNLDLIKRNPNDFFISPKDATPQMKFDARYLEGAIVINVDGKQLFDFTQYDYVDQLWIYLIDTAMDSISKPQVSCFFPDQPIKFGFLSFYGDDIFFVNDTKAKIIKREFVNILFDESILFFTELDRIFQGRSSYNKNPLNKILEAREKFNLLL